MKNRISRAERLKRSAKYAAIKITGREFMRMSKAERLAGLWWCLAFCLLGCTDLDHGSAGANLAIFSNFFAACGVVIWQQRKEARK